MDWKYKHFSREAVFQAPRELVLEAARVVVSESLGWHTREATYGLDATGYSAMHALSAKILIESTTSGTRVTVELLVERASVFGFMLVDIGGYYNGRIRKLIEGIQWQLHNKLTSASPSAAANTFVYAGPPRRVSRLWNLFAVVALLFLFLPLVFFVIFPLTGLVTGNLYIPARSGRDLTLHGTWARMPSAIVLIIVVLVVLKIRSNLHE
ncbi:MAG: hypothetical protein ABR555_02030 [Pyrinomonadaceae bacterium]